MEVWQKLPQRWKSVEKAFTEVFPQKVKQDFLLLSSVHSFSTQLVSAVRDLCIIAKKRIKRQNLNTASVLLTHVGNDVERD